MHKLLFPLLATLFVFVFDSTAQAQAPTITGSPATASGGAPVRVTGTGDPTDTRFDVSDDVGPIQFTVTWVGDTFTLEFRASPFDPYNPDNAIEVVATGTAGSDSAVIRVVP